MKLSNELYAQMDEGVRGFVRFLNANGFKTYQSCQGGECHPFRFATVLFGVGGAWSGFWLMLRLAVFLKLHRFDHFWISYQVRWVEIYRDDYEGVLEYNAQRLVMVGLPWWKDEFKRMGWL